jgi:hypothetical protein
VHGSVVFTIGTPGSRPRNIFSTANVSACIVNGTHASFIGAKLLHRLMTVERGVLFAIAKMRFSRRHRPDMCRWRSVEALEISTTRYVLSLEARDPVLSTDRTAQQICSQCRLRFPAGSLFGERQVLFLSWLKVVLVLAAVLFAMCKVR